MSRLASNTVLDGLMATLSKTLLKKGKGCSKHYKKSLVQAAMFIITGVIISGANDHHINLEINDNAQIRKYKAWQ